ncbi:MAG: xanthine dehydrogenase accessory protein XdhC [Rhizobiales bacterium]|nr:xanthine dehydrogenase accessory protein XdhC [Rhizobacter sp.]
MRFRRPASTGSTRRSRPPRRAKRSCAPSRRCRRADVNRTIRDTAERWLTEARLAVVVEVAGARGSAPREEGTRMLVSATEAIGTVGGGHLELKAIAHAREMLRTHELAPHTEHFPLGPALGQCCGGAVTLAYGPLDAEALARWPLPAPLFHLQLFGAGHVGRAIATLLATLDVSVDWIDEREDEFPPTTTLGTQWPAHIRRVCVDAVEGEVRVAPPGAFYLVLTHDHDLDLRITEAVLRRGDFAYLGLIGSKTKRQRFVHRFEQRGVASDAISRMTCPIGDGGIVGKAPEVIAVGVVAQLLAIQP